MKQEKIPIEVDRKIMIDFFASHPEEMSGVERATFAYHQNHREANAHYFCGSWREAACYWCQRTREQVRWGDEPPQCACRPKWVDESIESVIMREEVLFDRVLKHAEMIAERLDLQTLNGRELARIHHTEGVDPSMLECALIKRGRSLPQRLYDEYEAAYSEHRATGKRGFKRPLLVAKTRY